MARRLRALRTACCGLACTLGALLGRMRPKADLKARKALNAIPLVIKMPFSINTSHSFACSLSSRNIFAPPWRQLIALNLVRSSFMLFDERKSSRSSSDTVT